MGGGEFLDFVDRRLAFNAISAKTEGEEISGYAIWDGDVTDGFGGGGGSNYLRERNDREIRDGRNQ